MTNSEISDLSALAEGMRDAADAFGIAADQCLVADQEWVKKSILFLRNRAAALDAERRHAEARDAEFEARVEDLAIALSIAFQHASSVASWTLADDPVLVDYYRPAARELIESGWRKGDPE